MTIQQAVEKAIEGGFGDWRYKDHKPSIKITEDWVYPALSHIGIEVEISTLDPEARTLQRYRLPEILFDPQFWQCLGKSMWWYSIEDGVENDRPWLVRWHQFIDHLADGGTIESYFAQL